MKIFRLAFYASSAIVAVSGSTGAFAQARTAPGDSDANEIVVTAQKREESLIDVPQSVTAVSGAELEHQQAVNFKDYLKLVPGLQLSQTTPGFGRLVLRGVNTGGVASTVAVYQDETTFGSSSGLVNGAILAGDFDTFDVARIARGRASVETTKGGDVSYMGSAVVNAPLSDTLALRASGFYRDIGGFIDSIGTGGSDIDKNINSSKSYGGRVSALFKPSDAFSIQLGAYLQNLDVDASDSVDASISTGRALYGGLTQSQFSPERSDIRYRVYSSVIDYDFDFASLVSATSYSTLRQTFRGDLTPAFGPLIQAVLGVPNDFFQDQTTQVKRFTQELRLQSPESKVFEWLVGGYYTRERGLIDQNFVAATPGTTTPIAGLPLLGVAVVTSRYNELAGFANATLHLGDRFDLNFGGRYSHNRQRADQASDGALAGGPSVLPTARSSENVFTYSVSPKFKLGDKASIYARVAKGFRPGGPNVLPPAAPAALRSYSSDSLISYELGVKAETQDGSFAIDAAAFHIDWNNIQVFGVISNFGLNFNGGKAQSDGFEFTATLRPIRGLTTSINGAYTDAKLKDDTPAQVGGLSGDRLPYTPKFSVSVNSDYSWALGGDTEAYVGASVRTLSNQTAAFNAGFRAANGRQPVIPSYTVVDLRAGLDFGKFSLELYAKNLLDSAGKTSLELGAPPNVPFGQAGAGVIRPRSIGITLSAGF